jgi:hypothetical protein
VKDPSKRLPLKLVQCIIIRNQLLKGHMQQILAKWKMSQDNHKLKSTTAQNINSFNSYCVTDP